MTQVKDPRTTGRQALKLSVPPELWEKNHAFTLKLQAVALSHRLTTHPIIPLLDGAVANLDLARYFHLEFRHAFAQIFTDSIAHALVGTSQLEPRLKALGKVAARFVLTPRVLR